VNKKTAQQCRFLIQDPTAIISTFFAITALQILLPQSHLFFSRKTQNLIKKSVNICYFQQQM
jgi:hypothetical protein